MHFNYLGLGSATLLLLQLVFLGDPNFAWEKCPLGQYSVQNTKHTHIHTHTHTYTYIHIHTHTHTHIHKHTHKHTYTHRYTNTHTNTHTHTNAHTHTPKKSYTLHTFNNHQNVHQTWNTRQRPCNTIYKMEHFGHWSQRWTDIMEILHGGMSMFSLLYIPKVWEHRAMRTLGMYLCSHRSIG